MITLFTLLVALVGVLAGGVASIAGFGIGSLLTPLLALRVDTQLAVATVAIPHVVGTVQRLWKLRRHVDRRVLLGFGITSAAGAMGLATRNTVRVRYSRSTSTPGGSAERPDADSTRTNETSSRKAQPNW